MHGQQHYKFTAFFHKTEEEFEKYKNNDRIKRDWAVDNNILYIELPFNEEKKWKSIIDELSN